MPEPLPIKPACVLFDLDGTLLDTAPDMGAALNQLLQEQGKTVLPLAKIRPLVSHGTRALLQLGFSLTPEDDDYESMRQRFLAIYNGALAVHTTLFPGMNEVLNWLEDNAIPWGVVTNKPGWLTQPLLQHLALTPRTACIVSGDTTSKAKPHPEPLIYACKQVNKAPASCLYVGDAERDVQAGKGAGMATLVARYGYLHASEKPENWGANGIIDTPQQLLEWLN